MAHTSKTDKVLGLFSEKETTLVPSIKPPEREAVQPVFIKSTGGTQIVNIAFLLINEQLGSTFERFNCCSCDKCVSRATDEAMKNLPLKLIRVKRKSDEEFVNRAAAEMRSEAVRVLAKVVLSIKKNPKH